MIFKGLLQPIDSKAIVMALILIIPLLYVVWHMQHLRGGLPVEEWRVPIWHRAEVTSAFQFRLARGETIQISRGFRDEGRLILSVRNVNCADDFLSRFYGNIEEAQTIVDGRQWHYYYGHSSWCQERELFRYERYGVYRAYNLDQRGSVMTFFEDGNRVEIDMFINGRQLREASDILHKYYLIWYYRCWFSPIILLQIGLVLFVLVRVARRMIKIFTRTPRFTKITPKSDH